MSEPNYASGIEGQALSSRIEFLSNSPQFLTPIRGRPRFGRSVFIVRSSEHEFHSSSKFGKVKYNVRPDEHTGESMSSRLGAKIRELRKQKGLTLDQLAENAGLSKSYLWELENRESQRPSAEKLASLADYLGVQVTYFLEEDARSPQERHLDEAFFRGYQRLEPEAKEQLRKILDAFKKS